MAVLRFTDPGVRWRMPLALGAEFLADAIAAHRIPPSSDWVMGDAAAPRLRRLRVTSGGPSDEPGTAGAEWLPLLPAIDWIEHRIGEGRMVELAIDDSLRILAMPGPDGVQLAVTRRDRLTGEETTRTLARPTTPDGAATHLLLAWISLEPRPALAGSLVDASDEVAAAVRDLRSS